MENIQIPDSYFDYILKEKRAKMNLEHFVNSDYNEWMTNSDLAAIELTEDEMLKYAARYFSRFVNMPKPIDISSLRTNFVDGESYEAEYNAILNYFVSELNLDIYNIWTYIDIVNQVIFYGENQTIDVSQNVFFQDYLSQLTLNNTYDVVIIAPEYMELSSSDESYRTRRIDSDNGYICKEQIPM